MQPPHPPPGDTRQAGDSSDGVIARSQIAQVPVITAEGFVYVAGRGVSSCLAAQEASRAREWAVGESGSAA